ncbi:MAG: ATP-binding protein [Actinomycetota bacterium]|nr:ATP-binding protein [Actinomycetota bacterium]
MIEKNNTSNKGNIPELLVRIAIYDNLKSIPRIIDLSFGNINNLINKTSQKTYNLSHEIGGRIPYTIIREIIENLIHADFNEVIITILNNGNHIIVSDQGPGIDDKKKAFLPGYTSATRKMKEYIRGVGSGFPIIKETITFSGGSINVEDNVKNGTVISLKLSQPEKAAGSQTKSSQPREEGGSQKISGEKPHTETQTRFDDLSLSDRQQKILFIILELEEAGPSKIARELGFSLSTSYRELIHLEKTKLLISSGSGKRKLSKRGIKYLEYYSNNI